MLDDEDRRSLELTAYGGTASPAESAAARRALELDDAEVAKSVGAAAGTGGHDPESSDAGPDAGPGPATDPAPPGRSGTTRRSVFVACLAGAVAVGLIGGVLIDRAVRPWITVVEPASLATVTPTPGSSRFDSDPSVVASSREKILAAEALLAETPTADDEYPATLGADKTYVPSSTRLVATTPSKTRVWIAHEAGASSGYCLLSLDPAPKAGEGLALASCSLPDEFVSTGVTLSANGYDVTWKGGRVTVALGD